MGIYMVERELTGQSMAALTGFHATMITKSGAVGTSYLRSMFHPRTGRFFCLFEGPSAEAVQQANDAAGIPYKEVTLATDMSHPV
jgi:hypothetical protein